MASTKLMSLPRMLLKVYLVPLRGFSSSKWVYSSRLCSMVFFITGRFLIREYTATVRFL